MSYELQWWAFVSACTLIPLLILMGFLWLFDRLGDECTSKTSTYGVSSGRCPLDGK